MTLRVLQSISLWIKVNYSILIIAIISLSIRSALPGDGGGNSPADDLLAVRQANSILEGDWLGAWSYLTNSKPPGMPFYLVMVHYIPIEYKFVTHFFYLLASYFFVVQLTRYLKIKEGFTLCTGIGFGILALNAVIFQEQFNRVYRNTPTVIFVLIFYALFLKLMNLMRQRIALETGQSISSQKVKSSRKNKSSRMDRSLQRNEILRALKRLKSREFFTAVFLGFVFMMLQLFREDSYWILPSTLVVYLFETIKWKSSGRIVRRQAIRSFSLLLTAYISCVATSSPVIATNQSQYGASVTEDYFTGSYAKAIKLWQGVNEGADSRYFIPVTKQQREAVYEVSPTAKTLMPYLELGPNVGWKMNSCGSPIKVCDESAAWFPWELRDAAVTSGGARNAAEFKAIFQQISNDIEQACEVGSLSCGSPGIAPGSRALALKNADQFKSYFLLNLKYVFNLPTGGRISSPDRYSVPSQDVIKEWQEVVRYSPASSSIPLDLNRTSKTLGLYEKIWSLLFWFLLGVVMLAILLSIYSRTSRLIFPVVVLFMGSALVNAIGLSVFNLALGFFVAGSYLLNLQINFLACGIACTLYLVSKFVHQEKRSETV
jgi:hypothetical protein